MISLAKSARGSYLAINYWVFNMFNSVLSDPGLALAPWLAALSSEPEKRSVELEFLSRLIASGHPAFAPLRKGWKHRRPASEREMFEAFQNPIFAELAKELARTLPVDADFGRFRDDVSPRTSKPWNR